MFYTSGRTSNEAAFAYQLFVRSFGTNNLPDCSNMCHESSGSALTETIGIGKGSVSLEDIHRADLHRRRSGRTRAPTTRACSRRWRRPRRSGAKIIAVNPLPEAGPDAVQEPADRARGRRPGRRAGRRVLQIRLGGDLALFQAIGPLLLEAEDAAPGTVLDREFIERHTDGFEDYRAQARAARLGGDRRGHRSARAS